MFNRLPLQKRLMGIMLLTSGAVLLLTCFGFLAYEFLTFRKSMLRQLDVEAAIIADNCTAVLAFQDRDGAREILAGLKAEPHVTAAALYDADGDLFSTFPHQLPYAMVPAGPGPEGYRFLPSHLEGFKPVVQGGRRLGTLYIRADLKAESARFRTYGMVATVVAAVGALLALVLSRTLQGQVTGPVLQLAETARAVSEKHDYSVRARRQGTGELGVLTDAFNQMLTQIQEQLSRMDLINRITRAIGERLDLASIFSVVARTLEDNLPVDLLCTCMYEGAGDSAAGRLIVTGTGTRTGAMAEELGMARGARIPVDGSVLAECVKGRVAYDPDISGNGHPFPMRLGEKGLKSLFLAPLIVEGKVFGALLAARKEADGFSALDRDFLRQVADHAALAAHQAQLYGALQKAYDDLRQSQQTVMQQERLRALGQLASGIAHDINNAISPISLYVEGLLEREAGMSVRGRENLATISRAISDVADTVARMREFSRQRDSHVKLAPVQLNRCIHQVLELTRVRWTDMAQQKGLVFNVRTELAPDLPEVMGVESELREAFINLLLNAFDAMPEGGTLTFRTRLDRNGRILAEVADTGVGMSEETRRRALEPFFTTKGERGTGLGLAMVFATAERHNADVDIESAPGSGTTVRLTFAVAAIAAPAAPKAARQAAPSPHLGILVIDDDPLVAKVLKDTLEIDGHKVTTADGGEAGIRAFLESLHDGHPFEVVMTDLGMPYVDGGKVAAAVKEASPGTPVVLLTGWGQRLVDEGEVPLHVDKLLGKPPKLSELRDTLAALIPARAV